jgi:hypothetical protein
MSWRPHPRGADVDPSHPRAWGTCQRCNMIFNLHKLDWQWDWAGLVMINKQLLVCPQCLDKPSEAARRAIILPPDPDPLFNARPEPYSIDEGLIASFTASIAPDPHRSDRGIMTVTNITSGSVSTGAMITSGAASGTLILDQLSGLPPGAAGTYGVSPSQTAASTLMTTD